MRRLLLGLVLFSCSESTETDTGTADAGTAAQDATTPDASAPDAPDASAQDASAPDASAQDATAGLFPPGAWMYQEVSSAALHPRSSEITQWLTNQGGWGLGRLQIDFSILVLTADAQTPYVTRTPGGTYYTPDCDEVEVPIPAGGAVEGESGYECASGGDCHMIVVDRRINRLFELYAASYAQGELSTSCIAAWDMTRIYPDEGRGEQCTSADAAGFPIAPLLFYAEEIEAGEINHAIRFILPNDRMRAGYYVRPASHAGGPSANSEVAPTYGTRWRLRSDYPLATLPNEAARVVARAMQRYGIALSDGGRVALTAASDRFSQAKWSTVGLEARDLQDIQPNDFEVIDTGAPIPLTYACVRTPY